MKFLLVTLHCFFFFSFTPFAQQVVEVKYKTDAKGDYVFSCENNGYCNYIVEVNFTGLQNLRAYFKLPFVGNVQPGTNLLFTLQKENAGVTSNFRYSYRYVKGCRDPKVNKDYPYLLPVAPGKEVQAQELVYFLQRYMNEPAPQDWYAISIKMKAGDTVFAARRGTVTEVKDDARLREVGYTMASQDNYVEVYHEDCSFARYQVFRDQSIFVKAGQLVNAGEPIGIVGGDKYVTGPHVRFCVYYTLDKDAFPVDDKTNRGSQFAYVPVQFWTRETGKVKLAYDSTYISYHPAAIITQEMNKKEVKRWAEKHKE